MQQSGILCLEILDSQHVSHACIAITWKWWIWKSWECVFVRKCGVCKSTIVCKNLVLQVNPVLQETMVFARECGVLWESVVFCEGAGPYKLAMYDYLQTCDVHHTHVITSLPFACHFLVKWRQMFGEHNDSSVKLGRHIGPESPHLCNMFMYDGLVFFTHMADKSPAIVAMEIQSMSFKLKRL